MSSFERPKFLEGEELDDFYYSTPDPYTTPPPLNLNLGGLMKYAKEKGKKVVDLTKEEVDQFRVCKTGKLKMDGTESTDTKTDV